MYFSHHTLTYICTCSHSLQVYCLLMGRENGVCVCVCVCGGGGGAEAKNGH